MTRVTVHYQKKKKKKEVYYGTNHTRLKSLLMRSCVLMIRHLALRDP